MLTSIVRTVVPLIIGYLVQLLALINVTLTEDQSKTLSGLLTVVIAGIYYTFARLLEQKFPWATILLGSTQQPAAYSSDGSLTTPPADRGVPAVPVDSPEAIAADAAAGALPADVPTRGQHEAP